MITVMFSGGCDSTLVLYMTLMSRLKRDIHDEVQILTINCNQIPAQKEQHLARTKILEEFKKRELTNYVVNEISIITSDASAGIRFDYGLIQPIVWLTMAPLYVANKGKLQMGYRRGDDFWAERYNAEESFKKSCFVMSKTCEIEYPVQNYTKAEIITALKDRGLYDLCWYCEHPIATLDGSKPCGECCPCKTHKTALWQNETFKKEIPQLKFDSNDIKAKDVDVEDGPIPIEIKKETTGS